jgi:hypothetical protein
MERIKSALFYAVVVSETSHVFCCVLPTLVSIFSLLAGLGVISILPSSILDFHEIMHDWEIPMILISAFVLALGWVLHTVSLKIDCHDTGCHHGPCTPKKRSTSKMLAIATTLFSINIIVYFALHVNEVMQ